MKFVIQFLIIIGFSFAGEFLHYVIPLPIPASIYGIVLLFVALECKLLKVNDVRDVSSFLIAVMPMMFIPAGVGLLEAWGKLSPVVLPVVLIVVVSTVLVMGVSGRVTQFVIRMGKRRKDEGNVE